VEGEKAASLMVAVVGTVTRAREVQPKKAKLLMEARPAGLQVVRTKAAQPRKAALLADGGEAVGQRDGGEGGAAAEDRHWAKRLAGRVREVREEPLRRPGPASRVFLSVDPARASVCPTTACRPRRNPRGAVLGLPTPLFSREESASPKVSRQRTHMGGAGARCMWR